VSPTTQYSVQVSTSNGTSLLLAPDADVRALAVVVRLDATHGVPLGIGLGRDGRIAAAIFGSIRVDHEVTTTTPDTSAATAAAIIGVWKPLSIAGYDGPLAKPPMSEAPLLRFDTATTWSGSDGCNDLSGTYVVDRAGLHTGRQIVQSAVLCRLTLPLRQLMTTATEVVVAADRLTLLRGESQTLATFQRVKTPPP
jgi:heat shock protein HslJ